MAGANQGEEPEGESQLAASSSSVLKVQLGMRRLTRAAFAKTLEKPTDGRRSVFNVQGLHRLQETFQSLDRANAWEEHTDDRNVQKGEEAQVGYSYVKCWIFLFSL